MSLGTCTWKEGGQPSYVSYHTSRGLPRRPSHTTECARHQTAPQLYVCICAHALRLSTIRSLQPRRSGSRRPLQTSVTPHTHLPVLPPPRTSLSFCRQTRPLCTHKCVHIVPSPEGPSAAVARASASPSPSYCFPITAPAFPCW